jgi:translation initiation factor 3 subunit G
MIHIELYGYYWHVHEQSAESETSEQQALKATLSKAGAGKVVCRICKGDHFTAKLINIFTDTTALVGDEDADAPAPAPAPAAGGPSKYVPPSMRNRGPGESMGRPGGSRDDLPTLRVTNISEDTQENDLRELFGSFGRVARVYVGRDRDTGIGKGFAFVSFEERAVAQRAMEKMHGRGYDSLILNVQWSRKWFYCGFWLI